MRNILSSLLFSSIILVEAGLFSSNNNHGVVHLGDGKTYKYSKTVTKDGKTKTYTGSYTDNSVVTDGIVHYGGGTVNIGQKGNKPSKWWSSGSGDLNIGNGDRSKRAIQKRIFIRKDNSIHVKDTRIHGSGNINIGNGDRTKRGVWDIGVKTNTRVNWRKDISHYKDNSVVSNRNMKFGNGDMNIGNGDRSKRGVWDVNVKTNTRVNWRKSISNHKDNSVVSNGNMKFGNGDMNIGNGDRSKRSIDLSDIIREKRAFRGSLAIHDRRTKPGPPVNVKNVHGSGSAHIIIDDNTDPITLRGAKVHGSAKINIGG